MEAPAATEMGFEPAPAVEAFARAVRAALQAWTTPEVVEAMERSGTHHSPEVHAKLAAEGWVAPSWPAAYGGQERGPAEMMAFNEAAGYVGAPVNGAVISAMVGATILQFGSDGLKEEILPGIASGRMLCALGYTEAEAGSDLASVRTRATPDGGEWVLSGTKLFTTLGHVADELFVLARTDPEAPKHRGLSMFLVGARSRGITMTPIPTLGGERTNTVHLDEVRVPGHRLVGTEGEGWRVVGAALDHERVSMGWFLGETRRVLDDLVAHLRSGEPSLLAEPAVRQELAELFVRLEASELLLGRLAALMEQGRAPTVEAAMAKCCVTDLFKEAASVALSLAGPAGARRGPDPRAPAGGWLERQFRHSMVPTIYGGANEVMRNIVAQRGLGLPRS